MKVHIWASVSSSAQFWSLYPTVQLKTDGSMFRTFWFWQNGPDKLYNYHYCL